MNAKCQPVISGDSPSREKKTRLISYECIGFTQLFRMKGTYQYPDGSQYKGDWSDEGQREGYGIMKFTDGSQYYGMFQAGLCEGQGVMVFSDNSRYISHTFISIHFG